MRREDMLKDWLYMKLISAVSVMQVTDYSRDLEEMQNLSREEYLASLRR